MHFITKDEFEYVIGLLERAVRNKQVVYGADGTVRMDSLYFGEGDIHIYSSKQVMLIPPEQAAKNRLLEINGLISSQKADIQRNQKELENLELQAEQLRAIITKQKE